MAAHPAFTSRGQDGYILGRPAEIPAITGKMRPADPELAAAARVAEPFSTEKLVQATAVLRRARRDARNDGLSDRGVPVPAATIRWWGRLSETGFLGRLYDLDALPSTDPRHASAREDIVQHRVANFDWDNDWVFDDPRFQLANGPDQVLLDFLAHMAHPVAQPDTDQAARLVASLNTLLAPDGWELRTGGFISGRPVYSPSRTASGPGRMIRLEIGDDAGKLDIALGQAHLLLGEDGDALAQDLIADATLTLRRDGGYFHPIPGDNWTTPPTRPS
jgi:hypothetical protein